MPSILTSVLGFLAQIIQAVLIDQINRPGETFEAESLGTLEVPETQVQEALKRYGDSL